MIQTQPKHHMTTNHVLDPKQYRWSHAIEETFLPLLPAVAFCSCPYLCPCGSEGLPQEQYEGKVGFAVGQGIRRNYPASSANGNATPSSGLLLF